MNRSICFFIVGFLLICASAAFGTMDFVDPEAIGLGLQQLESLYNAERYDDAIGLARNLLGKIPKDQPQKQRAMDILTLSLDKQAQKRLAGENTRKREQNRKSSEQLISEATALMGEKKYAEALPKFKQAAQLFGGDAETFFMLGYAHHKLGQEADAYMAYKRCAQLNPDHPRALFHLSQLSYKLKRYQESETYSRKLIQTLNGKFDESRQILLEQRAASLNDKALATARSMVSMKKNLAQGYYLLGLLTARRGNWQEATDSFVTAIRIDPRLTEIYFHLGMAKFKIGQFHQASLAFERALFIGETTIREETARSKKLLDEGKADDAVAIGVKVKELENRMALVNYGIALCQLKKMETAAALESIEKTLSFKPDFLQARFARAVILASQREYQQALYEMRQILKTAAPNSPEAKKAIRSIKILMDQSLASAQGAKPIVSKPAAPTTEVNRFVKDMTGLGGRVQEEDWADLYPTINEITELAARRNFATALRKALHLQKVHPNLTQAWSIAGKCYMEMGRFEDALDSFKKALARNPNDPDSLGNIAYLYALKGTDLDKALAMAKQAIEFQPANAAFHHTLGWVWFRKGEMEKAIGELQTALQLRPEYPLARYNLALAFYLMGNFDQALAGFEAVMSAEPENMKARLFRAITLAKMQKVPDAVTALEDLKKKLPEKEVLLKVVTELHDRLKLAHERKTDIPVPVIAHTAPIKQLLEKAMKYRRQGLVNRAKELYLECQRLHPAAFQPWYELGAMYAESGLSEPAKRAWEQALKLKPNDYTLQVNIGRMQFKLNDRTRARAAFTAAQALKPEDPEPPYYLGLIAYEESRFESAESHALAALRLKPRYYKAMALLGMSRIRLGRYQAARDAYETLYAKAPRDSSIRRHARKKLWIIARLMQPNRAPSFPDAELHKEELEKRAAGKTSGDSQDLNAAEVKKAVADKWNRLSTEDKIWLYRRLEPFGGTGKVPADVAAQAAVSSIAAPMTTEEKLMILKKLDSFKTMAKAYPPPPPRMSSKYKLGKPAKPKRKPDDADPFIKQALESAEKGFITEAVSALEKGREISPKNLELLINLGFLELQLGNFKSSFEVFAQAALHHPKSPLAHLCLGHMYWLGGRGSEAVDQWKQMTTTDIDIDVEFSILRRAENVWKRVLDNNPTDADAHSNLGIVYLFSGKLLPAIAEFESVLQLAPQRIEHRFYSAQAYSLLYITGNNKNYKREARARLQDLANSGTPFPHSPTLYAFLEKL